MEKPHKKLDVWKLSMDMVTEVYRITASFPSRETYGLTDQLRRAAVSVPSNISEGAARQTKKEFIHFLHIAQGSLSELDTQLDIAVSLGYYNSVKRDELDTLLVRIDKMLYALIRSLRESVRA
jgi:four helix bundle protein